MICRIPTECVGGGNPLVGIDLHENPLVRLRLLPAERQNRDD